MAEAQGGGEKTEKPTAKKLTDAAKKGDILQSRELSTAMVVMAGIGWMAFAGPALMEAIRQMLADALRFDSRDIALFEPAQRAEHLISVISLPLAGILFATVVAAIAAPAMLGSLGFRAGAMAPKASRLSPAAGLKRMFGMQGLIELIKSLTKVVLLGAIGFYLIWQQIPAIQGMARTAPSLNLFAVGLPATLLAGLLLLALAAPVMGEAITAALQDSLDLSAMLSGN